MESNNNVESFVPSWITPSKFESIFKEICSNYKQLKDFRVKKPLADGENYATIMLRIEADLQLIDGALVTKSLMLKTPSASEMIKNMMNEYNFFEVEATIYRDVIPELQQMYKDIGLDVTFGPKFYELDTNEPYILLENLHQRNFKNSNRIEGLNEYHTKHTLTKLAQWHAATATRVSRKGPYNRKFIEGFFRPEGISKMRDYFNNIIKYFAQSINQYNDYELYYNDLIKLLDNIVDELYKTALNIDDNEFNVLNHGDFWSNNVMFQYDMDGNILETYIIDYQMVKYGPPVQDLLYFLLSSTKYDIKLKRFDYFIAFYHQQLIKYLKLLQYPKKMPTLKELHLQLYKNSIWGLNTVVGVMAAVLLDPTKQACLDNFLGDSDAANNFKRQMYSSERYRKHAEALLPWLYYRGLLEVS